MKSQFKTMETTEDGLSFVQAILLTSPPLFNLCHAD
jgi:hypothetical protein